MCSRHVDRVICKVSRSVSVLILWCRRKCRRRQISLEVAIGFCEGEGGKVSVNGEGVTMQVALSSRSHRNCVSRANSAGWSEVKGRARVVV